MCTQFRFPFHNIEKGIERYLREFHYSYPTFYNNHIFVDVHGNEFVDIYQRFNGFSVWSYIKVFSNLFFRVSAASSNIKPTNVHLYTSTNMQGFHAFQLKK